MANRLSEDPGVNVLLLEAGPSDGEQPDVELPGLVGQDITSVYNWNLSTVPQTHLNDQPRSLPQGRGLGGGTLINGMLWNRGGVGDYEMWAELNNDSSWSWNGLLPYFMKSETFTPVTNVQEELQYSIEYDPNVHGYAGPVNVSYPNFIWNQSAYFFAALNELGVPTAFDPNTGEIAGASFLPLDLDPQDEMRSSADKAYYNPYASRPNLYVSTGQYVTQILFAGATTNTDASAVTTGDNSVGQGSSPGVPGGIFGGTTTYNVTYSTSRRWLQRTQSVRYLWQRLKRMLLRRQSTSAGSPSSGAAFLTAIGVEFAASASSGRQNVTATREVIVAAGALHSPQLLMLSGIGPTSQLQAQGISVNIDLPGVGQNLQDHGQVWCWYPYHNNSFSNPTELTNNHTFAADAWIAFWANATGPFTTPAIEGVAFPSLPYILNGSTAIADTASDQSPDQYLAAGTDPTVIAGYTKQFPLLIQALNSPTRAAYEILNANDGVLTVSNMRPFSRGSVTLSSSQPFDPPVINPRYCSNPVDAQVLVAAMQFNQRLIATNSLSEMDPIQIYPPPNCTDEEFVQYIDDKLQTEYHPSGTNAMMPLELGGVVSPELLVYGTSNLRVVDSSIMPMLPAAHLQAVVYGIAEKVCSNEAHIRQTMLICYYLTLGRGYHQSRERRFDVCQLFDPNVDAHISNRTASCCHDHLCYGRRHGDCLRVDVQRMRCMIGLVLDSTSMVSSLLDVRHM